MVAVILALTVAVHLLQRMDSQITYSYAHITFLVSDGEWWRVVTSAFLHSTGSLLHIIFNMYALYAFGPHIERRVGSARFAGLYFACAVAGGIAFQAFSEGAAVGASGAIFGLFGAILVETFPLRHTPAGSRQLRQLLLLLSINLALPLLARGIAWEAHVGGLLAGIFIAWAWQRLPSGTPSSLTALPYAVAFTGLALSTFL